jgi:hypothetical protein
MTTQFLNSNYQNLIVSGCSFTSNNHESSCSWANLLADWSGMDIVNLGVDAAGNRHVANSIMLYLERNRPDPKTTLIMPMWTSVTRTDFITDRKSHVINPRPVKEFYYDEFTQLYSICEYKEKHYYGPWAGEYKHMQSAKSLCMQSWIEINNLTNYLTHNQYTFKYLEFMDILHGRGILETNFLNELKTLNLTLDLSNWLLISDKEPLGEFALYHDQVCEDGVHPALQAHESWTREKLIPELLRENILLLQ